MDGEELRGPGVVRCSGVTQDLRGSGGEAGVQIVYRYVCQAHHVGQCAHTRHLACVCVLT